MVTLETTQSFAVALDNPASGGLKPQAVGATRLLANRSGDERICRSADPLRLIGEIENSGRARKADDETPNAGASAAMKPDRSSWEASGAL